MAPAWQFGLVGILVVASVTDWQHRKIFNWLTFPAILVGFALSAAMGGLNGLLSSVVAFLIGAVVIGIGWLFTEGMGAGDVKLMAAIGAWLGWPAIMAALLYSTLIGGIASIVAAAAAGNLIKLFRNTYEYFFHLFTPGMKPILNKENSAAAPLPYGISIAVGTALSLFYPEPVHLINLILGRP